MAIKENIPTELSLVGFLQSSSVQKLLQDRSELGSFQRKSVVAWFVGLTKPIQISSSRKVRISGFEISVPCTRKLPPITEILASWLFPTCEHGTINLCRQIHTCIWLTPKKTAIVNLVAIMKSSEQEPYWSPKLMLLLNPSKPLLVRQQGAQILKDSGSHWLSYLKYLGPRMRRQMDPIPWHRLLQIGQAIPIGNILNQLRTDKSSQASIGLPQALVVVMDTPINLTDYHHPYLENLSIRVGINIFHLNWSRIQILWKEPYLIADQEESTKEIVFPALDPKSAWIPAELCYLKISWTPTNKSEFTRHIDSISLPTNWDS